MSATAGSRERLAYMANQIARNLEIRGHERAVRAAAEHMTAFWDPRMRAEIQDILAQDHPELCPIAREAVARLDQSPSPQPGP